MDIQKLVIEYGQDTFSETLLVYFLFSNSTLFIEENLVAIWPEERHDLVALGKQESFQRL